MLFNDSFLTDAGANLFAIASSYYDSSDPTSGIIWGTVRTSNYDTNSLSDTDMKALTDIKTNSTSYNTSGVVTSTIRNNDAGSLSIFSEINNDNTTTGSNAYTLGIWAKLANDSNETLVVVARTGSGVTPSYINPASSGHVISFVNLEIEISGHPVSSTTSAANWYASADALQELADNFSRVVTTHIAGDPAIGEAQTVYGEKTFIDKLSLKNILSATSYASESNGEWQKMGIISPTEVETYGPMIIMNYTDDAESEPEHRYLYSASLMTAALLGLAGSAGFTCSIDSRTNPTTYEASMMVSRGLGDSGTGITVTPNTCTINCGETVCKTIIPDADDTYSLGASNKRFKEAYAIDMTVTSLHSSKVSTTEISTTDSGNYIQLDANIIPGDSILSIGTQSIPFGFVYSEEVDAGNAVIRAVMRSSTVSTTEIVSHDSGNNIQLDSNIIAGDTGLALGTSIYPLGSAYFSSSVSADSIYTYYLHRKESTPGVPGEIQLGSHLMPENLWDGGCKIGDTGRRFGEVHSIDFYGNLHGCTPYPPATGPGPIVGKPPVGSIFLAYIETSLTGRSLSYADVIDATNLTSYSIATMGVARFEIPGGGGTMTPGAEWSAYNSITTGKYVALSSGATTNHNKMLCLVTRIE